MTPAVLDSGVIAGQDRKFQIPFQLSSSAAAIRKIVRKYRDRKIDLAGACLIHAAEQLDTGDVLTLDRDFEVYRWAKMKCFNLLVELN